MSICHKYALDGSKLVVLSYVEYCIIWYTSEELGNWLVYTLRNIFHVNFLGYENWFFPLGYHNLRTIIFKWIKKDMLHLLFRSI